MVGVTEYHWCDGANSYISPGRVQVAGFSVTGDVVASWHPPVANNTPTIIEKPKEGTKLDAGKPRMDLLPYDALVEIAKVLGFGANKYTPGNWAKGLDFSRLLAACERHLGEYKEGRDVDFESGINHIAHAACNLLFVLWMQKHHPERDDRWIKETQDSGNNAK
jgi:hypothetical protein